ncbi:MAG TPA: deoxyribonuclease IV [Vicinamibacterales bacterium]|nr:deoxyribonuclease IV [Vicinamibacterales bacterium]
MTTPAAARARIRIGAHMSTAGGVTRAVERAVLHGCEALQIFAKNNARWRAAPIDPDEARRFRDAVTAAALAPAVSHASYLINLAAPPGALRDQSIAAFIDEIDRADLLGLHGVVVHPGVAAAGISEDEALRLVAAALGAVFAARPRSQALVLLEHTAGQGRSIGHRFDHLAAILGGVDGSSRVGVCLDTCHLIAAGYDIATPKGYASTFTDFAREVGLGRLKLIHANDSKRPLGSRLDRHEHIGEGHVGIDAFRRIARDPRFAHLAMVIETHKTPGICDHPRRPQIDPLDRMNLETLRRLRRRA